MKRRYFLCRVPVDHVPPRNGYTILLEYDFLREALVAVEEWQRDDSEHRYFVSDRVTGQRHYYEEGP